MNAIKKLLIYRYGIEIGKLENKDGKYYYSEKNLETNMYSDSCLIDHENLTGKATFFMYHDKLLPLLDQVNSLTYNQFETDSIELLGSKYIAKIIDANETIIYCDMGKTTPAMDIIVHKKQPIGIVSLEYETTVYVVPGYEDYTPIKDWNEPHLSIGGHGVKLLSTHMVEMRDGIKLATDVFVPADYKNEDTLPVLLMRTPYSRKFLHACETHICDRGYAFVSQDIRGTGDSQGDFPALMDEDWDSSDTIDWIVSQAWCDGNIGSQGGSYEGYWQIQAICSGNKALKCANIFSPAISMFDSTWRRSGGVVGFTMSWLLTQAAKRNPITNPIGLEFMDHILEKPFIDMPKKVIGFIPEVFQDMADHIDQDEFWEKDRIVERLKDYNIPILLYEGLYDSENVGARILWESMQDNDYADRKMILGPWPHICNGQRSIGDETHGINGSYYNMEIEYLKWYDKHLKHMKNDICDDIVSYYVVGEDKWYTSEVFPPKDSKQKVFYLGTTGNAATDIESGKLNEKKPGKLGKDSYVSDPENVPTTDLFPDLYGKSIGPYSYDDIEAREDVLTYTTDPFVEDIVLIGSASLKLYAISTAVDTDWVARITIVRNDGKSVRLTDETMVARYRNGYDKSEYLTPGEVYEYVIKLPFVSRKFTKGERLRLEICSGRFGLFLPNTQTDENPFYATKTVIATNTLLCGGDFPSALTIYCQ
ncbi:MAG: CocE/NonD family hydrolase [Eubacteriales bacterium]|nr:CocE/NonD family hydrolase [Eubacteriales bacterium]